MAAHTVYITKGMPKPSKPDLLRHYLNYFNLLSCVGRSFAGRGIVTAGHALGKSLPLIGIHLGKVDRKKSAYHQRTETVDRA
jgi:hypothetical protein